MFFKRRSLARFPFFTLHLSTGFLHLSLFFVSYICLNRLLKMTFSFS